MAVDSTIPVIFDLALLPAYNTELVFANSAITTTSYTGELKNQGDRVRINVVSDPTISSYTKNTNLGAAETLNTASLDLIVDQGKSFHFQEDQVDQIQSNANVLAEAARRSAYGFAKAIDSYIAGLYTDVSTTNTLGTDASPITITSSNAYEYLIRMKTLLDKQDTPRDSRFCVVSPDYEAQLLQDDRFVKSGTNMSDGRLINGNAGNAAGFNIFVSNNLANVSSDKYKILAGHPSAWASVQQYVGSTMYVPELRHASAMKGLCIYGAKVLRPDNLALTVAHFS